MSIYKNCNFDEFDLSENISDDVLIESDKPSDTENEFMIKGFTPYTEDKKRKIPISDKSAALVDPDDVEECDEEYEPWVRSYVKNFFETKKERKKRKKKARKKSKKKSNSKIKKKSKIKSKKAKSNKSNEKSRSTKDTDLVVENAILRTKLADTQYSKDSLIQGIFIGAWFMAKDDTDREKIDNVVKLISSDTQIATRELYMTNDGGDRNGI